MTKSDYINAYVKANRMLAEELIKTRTAAQLMKLCTGMKFSAMQIAYVMRKKAARGQGE